MLFTFLLAVIAYFDLKERRIPLPCLALGGVLWIGKSAVFLLQKPNYLGRELFADILLTAVILLPTICIYFFWKGSMGLGDLLLLALSGVCIGHERILTCLFCTFVLFFLISVGILCAGGSKNQTLPFAPFLLCGYSSYLLLEFLVT